MILNIKDTTIEINDKKGEKVFSCDTEKYTLSELYDLQTFLFAAANKINRIVNQRLNYNEKKDENEIS